MRVQADAVMAQRWQVAGFEMTLPQLESKLARGGGKSLTKKHTVGNWEVPKKNNLNGVKDFNLKAKAKIWP